MGLKFAPSEAVKSYLRWLKSDQNGIEISSMDDETAEAFTLKSDQNGIEIFKEDAMRWLLIC